MLLFIGTAISVKIQRAAYQGRITGEAESNASSIGSVTRSQGECIRTQQIPAVSHSKPDTTVAQKMAKNTRHIEAQRVARSRTSREAKYPVPKQFLLRSD